MAELPKWTQDELIPMLNLRRMYPHEFMSNKTEYFLRELIRYIKEKRVFRLSIMAEPRSGKSEIASTICFLYVNAFNKFYDKGHFKNMDFKKDEIKIKKIEFNVEYVYDNQMIYNEIQKDRNKKNTMVFGQIHQIDEHKQSTGGIGSFSQQIEGDNLNNITAKFMQSEIWIQPDAMQVMNCPFGLELKKKDMVNRVNWCLLWKIDAIPSGGTEFKFLGWVKIPLHHNEDFRKRYNELKNAWIKKEVSGRVDERAYRRTEAAKFLLRHYAQYFEQNEKGKYKYGHGKILEIIAFAMENGQIDANFNYTEQISILNKAYLLNENPELIKKNNNTRG